MGFVFLLDMVLIGCDSRIDFLDIYETSLERV